MPDNLPYGDSWRYGSNGYKGGPEDELHYYAMRKLHPLKDMTGDMDDNLHIQGRYLDQAYFQGWDLEREIFPSQATTAYGMLQSWERTFDATVSGGIATRQATIQNHFQALVDKDKKLNPNYYIGIANQYGYDATIYEGINDMFIVHDSSARASHLPHQIWDRGHGWTWWLDSTGSTVAADRTALMTAVLPRVPAFTYVIFSFA